MNAKNLKDTKEKKLRLVQTILSRIWMFALFVIGMDYVRHGNILLFNIASFALAFLATLWFFFRYSNGRRWIALWSAGIILWYLMNYFLLFVGQISQEQLISNIRPATNFFAWLPVWFLYAFQPIESIVSGREITLPVKGKRQK